MSTSLVDPATRAAGLAVVCNPLSGRVRRRLATVRGPLERLAPAAYHEASEPEGIRAAVREVTRRGAPVLCVVGGDGTLHAVLTALAAEAPPSQWPQLTVVPAGSTNMSATDLGARRSLGRRLSALGGWAEGRVEGRLVRRAVARVEGPDGVVRCGMFLGIGAVSDGVAFFRERLQRRGIEGGHKSALSVAWVLMRLARGGRFRQGMAPAIDCRVEGRPVASAPSPLCLVSTLDRLLLGARPHWGTEAGPLRVTLVQLGARSWWTSLPRLAAGRPGRRLTPERGYHSHCGHTVTLGFSGRYVIDGELYLADPSAGPLRVTAIPDVAWLVI